MLTIEEQKTYLCERLEIECLRFSEENKEEIRSFEQATRGRNIAEYLKNEAWDADKERKTKVFLIKDKETKEIAYYFAINCGILYEELDKGSLREEEKKLYEKYLEAYILYSQLDSGDENFDEISKQYVEAMEELCAGIADADRTSVLMSRADDECLQIQEKRERFSDTDEEKHIMNVKETFPAIDIKFLCRNKKYVPKIHLDFKLGVYIFWEKIVPYLLQIAEQVGCEYLYLFAADNSNEIETVISEPIMYTKDYYDSYEDDKPEEGKKERRLVEYYQKELKFKYVTKYKILKPHYERTCFTLVQKVAELEENRDIVWKTHINMDDDAAEG